MKTKLFDSLRAAFSRTLWGAVGIWCVLGPIILLNASGSPGWGLTTVLGLLLLLCYAVVIVICFRAKWDTLKRLVSETTLAMCFMIIGLLTNEVTGIFIDLKHKLVIVYAFVGFLVAELVKPKGLIKVLNEFERKQTANPTKAVTESESSEERSSAELVTQNDALAKELAALSSRLAENQRTLDEYKRGQLVSVGTESQQLREMIDSLRNQIKASESELKQSTVRIQEAVGLGATLQTEIAALKQQIAEREDAIETLQSAAQSAAKIQSENQQICLENRRLQEELTSHRIQLNASESRLQEWARRNQEVSDRYGRVEAEVADLKRQLRDSQSKDREIETARQQLAKLESREMLYRQQQQQLAARIVDLERELSEGKKQLQALDGTRQRLRETERVCQELAEENRRLWAEIPVWRERLAAGAELSSDQGGLLAAPMPSEIAASATKSLHYGSQETHGAQLYLRSGDSVAGIHLEKEEEANWIPWTSVKRQWRFGAVAATVVVITGAVITGVLGTKFSTLKEVAVAPENSSQEYTVKAVSEPQNKPAPETSFQEYIVEAVSKPQKKPAPRLKGTFQTVRPTQVYSGPSENSAWIADIGAGMKLHVIDSTYGWLEIRSRHGRPPGFVRQEAAVNIARN